MTCTTTCFTAYISILTVWYWHESDENATVKAFSTTDLYNEFNIIPTLRQTKPRERPEAAICVRKSSARRVLHFTPLFTVSCVLHRSANRVIHRLQLYLYLNFYREKLLFQGTNLHNLYG